MFKYKTFGISTKIEKIEVISETTKRVVIAGKWSRSKRGDYVNYFDTFEQAKQYLVDRLAEDISCAELNLEYLKNQHIRATALIEAPPAQIEDNDNERV